MTRFRQFVLAVMIPMNVAMVLWVWIGRGLFGATLGWVAMFGLFTAVPLMVVLLTISTWLAFAQRRRPVRLTTAQAWAQVALWSILLALGVVVFDVDDNTPEESILINLLDWPTSMLDVSAALMKWLALAAIAAWAVLVVTLASGRREASL